MKLAPGMQDSTGRSSQAVRQLALRRPVTNIYLRLTIIFSLMLLAGSAQAVPSFSRQTQLDCNVCHTAYPQLTPFGRQFKLQGYTLQSGNVPALMRISGMLQPSITHTAKDQPGGAADHFSENDNFAVTQASVFYGGRLVNSYDKLGAFIQVTYDGIGRSLSWDLADVRWANSGSFAGKPMVWGLDLNNAPSVQDVWNTTPIWGFPFSGSGLAPGPDAATLISDPLAGTVAGLGAYAQWNNTVYAEFNFYKTLSRDFLEAVGVRGIDQEIKGVAPYWRLALEHQAGPHYIEVGTFGLYADTYPGRDHSAGMTDRFVDTGLDLQYEYTARASTFTTRAAYIHEDQKLRASTLLGGADNRNNHLNTLALNADYLYDRTYGVDVGYNHIGGSNDATLFGGSPDSDYYTLQLDWLPLNKVAGTHATNGTFNPKLSLQYTAYSKLNGTSNNASDNNTLYLQAWLAM